MVTEKQQGANGLSATLLQWMGTALVTIVWISSGLFGLYILAFYAAAAYQGEMNRWNKVLPELYRMDYGFWILLTDGWGHQDHFSGPFDQVMAFFFYLPNLLVAEIFIQKLKSKTSLAFNLVGTLLLLAVNGFLVLGTYFFTKHYWGPAILNWIIG